jgi:hypothetical protein
MLSLVPLDLYSRCSPSILWDPLDLYSRCSLSIPWDPLDLYSLSIRWDLCLPCLRAQMQSPESPGDP